MSSKEAGREVGAINSHYASFSRLCDVAEGLLSKGKLDASAAYSQMAAHYAWQNHPGLFASRRLERILIAIGQEVARSESCEEHATCCQINPRRVLHVLTQAYELGGHTRMVWRWIEQDAKRTHSVVLTRQGESAVPPSLENAVSAVGGKTYCLDKHIGGLLSRARALRNLASCTDLLVLHVHPYDVVPIIALADKRNCPPTIFMNHADHVFWLGLSISDAVANIRKSGLRLSVERRGVEKERCRILPIPLEPVTGMLSQAQAKKKLGLPADSVVLLSIASKYKYTSIKGDSFLDALHPILEKYSQVVLVVVGPDQDAEWMPRSPKTQRRIWITGRRKETAVFYEAADIYLDSFPFASLTSVLEAGAHGVPLVSYCPHLREAEVLCSDDPSLDDLLLRSVDRSSYQVELSHLIEDRERRMRLGEETRENILRTHMGEGWSQFLEDLYLCASKMSTREIMEIPVDQEFAQSLDFWLTSFHRAAGLSSPAREIIGFHAGLLPFALRFKLSVSEFKKSHSRAFRVLIPEWARTLLKSPITMENIYTLFQKPSVKRS